MKHALYLGLLAFTFISLPNVLQAKQINHAVGIGLNYAGIVGYQISVTEQQHKVRAAIGVIGISAGYDYLLSEHYSVGATYTNTLREVYSFNVNYYPSSTAQGINLGIDFSHMPDTNGDGFFNTNGSKNVIWLNAGYIF